MPVCTSVMSEMQCNPEVCVSAVKSNMRVKQTDVTATNVNEELVPFTRYGVKRRALREDTHCYIRFRLHNRSYHYNTSITWVVHDASNQNRSTKFQSSFDSTMPIALFLTYYS